MMLDKHTARFAAYLLLFALALGLLTACSTQATAPGTSSVTDPQLSGTAQGWSGGSAALRAVGTNGELDYTVGQGSIAASGDFTLNLSEAPSVPASFGPLTCHIGAGETGKLESTPSTLSVTLVQSFGVTTTNNPDDPKIGEVVNIKGSPAGPYTKAIYAYASAPGTVKGTCGRSDKTATINFDLTLVAGWNNVVTTAENSSDQLVGTFRTATLPTDLSWVYHAFPAAPPSVPGSSDLPSIPGDPPY